MKECRDYRLDGRKTRIRDTNFMNWWILQQLFTYLPFEEFFDTDKLISYYEEFKTGGIYQLELNIKNDIWVPIGLISWRAIIIGEHPLNYLSANTAYISDSITYRGYQNKGVQRKLFNYAFDKMREAGFTMVYLRTSSNSNMCKLAEKLGFVQDSKARQKVTTMRVGGHERTDERIFFVKVLK